MIIPTIYKLILNTNDCFLLLNKNKFRTFLEKKFCIVYWIFGINTRSTIITKYLLCIVLLLLYDLQLGIYFLVLPLLYYEVTVNYDIYTIYCPRLFCKFLSTFFLFMHKLRLGIFVGNKYYPFSRLRTGSLSPRINVLDLVQNVFSSP